MRLFTDDDQMIISLQDLTQDMLQAIKSGSIDKGTTIDQYIADCKRCGLVEFKVSEITCKEIVALYSHEGESHSLHSLLDCGVELYNALPLMSASAQKGVDMFLTNSEDYTGFVVTDLENIREVYK